MSELLVIVCPSARNGNFFALSYGIKPGDYHVINRPEQVSGLCEGPFVVVLGGERPDVVAPTVRALLLAGFEQIAEKDFWRLRA